ncbi:MAG: sigma-E processing peptidase SpoIIGA [Dysosmobacter sp.]
MVYLDSVFLFNALLDYLLFLSTARLAGIPLRRRRYLLSGVLGGLYAAAVFLPGGGFLTETLVKAGVGLLLALIAFGRETHFLRLTLLTVAIACALAGTVLALGLLAGQHIPNARGIFYTNVNGKTLLLSASGVYLLLTVIFRTAAAHGIRGVSAGDGVPAGANGGPHRIAGHGQQPAGHRRGTGADGRAVPVPAACSGHPASLVGGGVTYTAPTLSGSCVPSFCRCGRRRGAVCWSA